MANDESRARLEATVDEAITASRHARGERAGNDRSAHLDADGRREGNPLRSPLKRDDIVTAILAAGGGVELRFNVTNAADLTQEDREVLTEWLLSGSTQAPSAPQMPVPALKPKGR